MNFILFNPDEMRAESVGCYGHRVVQTPHMDALAAQGVRFDQAHVQHTVCTPSRCSFMTGWYPHVRGHRTLWHALRPHEPNLLKYLKRSGYEVVWSGKNDLLAEASFADSVDIVFRPRAGVGPPPERTVPPGQPGSHSFLYQPREGTIDDLSDMGHVDNAIAFLRRPHDRPFVLYLPLSMPHCPYTAPQPYYDMVAPEDLPALRPAGRGGQADFHRWIRRFRRLDEIDEKVFRKINAVYLGMIACVDEMLGRLLAALDETGLADETAVLVFSDHGDWAGDYGLVEKWPSALDDCLTRVPLIVRAPDGKAGHVVNEPVELMDVFATILDLAGVRAEHTHFSRSLTRQIEGAAGDPDRAVFAEGGYDAFEPHCFEGRSAGDQAAWGPDHIYAPKGAQQQAYPLSVCRSVMIRTAGRKLVRRSSGAHELYDLMRDPWELTNVHGDATYATSQAALERHMLDWFIRTSDVTPPDEDFRGIPEAFFGD